jgi:hypothetical protein
MHAWHCRSGPHPYAFETHAIAFGAKEPEEERDQEEGLAAVTIRCPTRCNDHRCRFEQVLTDPEAGETDRQAREEGNAPASGLQSSVDIMLANAAPAADPKRKRDPETRSAARRGRGELSRND